MKPDIILIMTDQQRWDTIHASRHPHMITPNMDTLCKGGVNFRAAFAPGATCIASRAAIFTGMYPHNTGVYSFNRWEHQNTWVSDLAQGGYRCVNIGKMHTDPIYAPNGFHERFVVENKCQDFGSKGLEEDEWGKFLLANGLQRPLNRGDRYADWRTMLNTVAWEYDEKYHSDVFVGERAAEWITRCDCDGPLFLQIGFPGPHEPYDPPKRFVDMYDSVTLPAAIQRRHGPDNTPPQHLAHKLHFKNTPNNAVIDFDNATESQIAKMRKHYYANITLIDEKIGEIIDALEQTGRLKNSIVIFTSDHGDCLGDYQLPYKWLMYDSMVRVPFIIRDFRDCDNRESVTVDGPVSLMDIGPTILDYAQCDIPTYIEGRSLAETVRTKRYDQPAEYVFCEDNYLIMIRTAKYKLVYYIDQLYGELYDLENDPGELENLWEQEDCQQLKLELKSRLLDWLAKSNYRNAGYKQTKARQYPIRWPQCDGFGYNLQGKPITDEQQHRA